jgi:hypothetical protein
MRIRREKSGREGIDRQIIITENQCIVSHVGMEERIPLIGKGRIRIVINGLIGGLIDPSISVNGVKSKPCLIHGAIQSMEKAGAAPPRQPIHIKPGFDLGKQGGRNQIGPCAWIEGAHLIVR